MMRHTKIVCTLGPASADPAILAQLIQAGMDVARVNFSHGDHAAHAETIAQVRAVAAQMERPVAILGDLQGPKLRVGALPAAGFPLQPGKIVTLSIAPATGEIPIQYAELPQLVTPNDRLLLDDGLLELEVIAATATSIQTRVIMGGLLFANKGINLPRADMRIPAITDKDRADLRFALTQGLDWIALSFVRTAQEVLDLKGMIRIHGQAGQLPQVVAKIEKPEAVEAIAEIVEVTDAIMVARGDLGIEMPAEEVPMIQKEIIRLCNQAGRPVITATQMLDSMIRNPRPTRAEASDVANAVIDGADAVMLSGETASGKYPVRAVQVMDRIVSRAEEGLARRGPFPRVAGQIHFAAQAIARAATDLATNLGAAAILAPTTSGYTARQLSHHRPGIPIIAVTPNPTVMRQLNLHWGVYPLEATRRNTTDEVVEDAVQLALRRGLVKEGQLVVITAGSAGSTPGTTNLIKIRLIEQVLATGQGLGDQKARGRVRKLRPPLPATLKIQPSDVVVAHSFDSSWQPLVTAACGLIAEEGSPNSVAVRLAENLKIPALVNAEGAFDALQEGELVVIDPARGIVYRGLGLDDLRSSEASVQTDGSASS